MTRLATAVALGLTLLLAGCASVVSQIQQHHDAQVAFGEGLRKYDAGDYAGARPMFERAVSLESAFDDAEAYLAWTDYYLGRFPQAALHFRQVISRQPGWHGPYDGLGWTRYRQGRYHIALVAFRQTLEIAPAYRDAAVGSAFSLFELGRYREARPLLQRLTEDGSAAAFRAPAPDLEEVRTRYAWTLYHLGEYDRARAEFARGIAAHPDWYGLHDGMGWSQLRMGDRTGARASFQRALELRPNYADARQGLQQTAR